MLKLFYDDKTSIPEGAENFYIETDGKFKLNADVPDVSKLESTLDKERKSRREAEAKVKEFDNKFSFLPDDFDQDTYKKLADQAGGDIETRLKEQRESIESVHKRDLEKLTNELAEKDNLVTTHVKNAELRKAMAENNISKAFMPAVEAMMSQKIKVEGADVYLNEKPISEALKEWASSEDGKHYVQAPANGGGGSDPKAGGNPSVKANLGGDKTSRVEALRGKYPELNDK